MGYQVDEMNAVPVQSQYVIRSFFRLDGFFNGEKARSEKRPLR